MPITVNKELLCVEDMNTTLGATGSVSQTRGGTALTLTPVWAGTLLYAAGVTIKAKIDSMGSLPTWIFPTYIDNSNSRAGLGLIYAYNTDTTSTLSTGFYGKGQVGLTGLGLTRYGVYGLTQAADYGGVIGASSAASRGVGGAFFADVNTTSADMSGDVKLGYMGNIYGKLYSAAFHPTDAAMDNNTYSLAVYATGDPLSTFKISVKFKSNLGVTYVKEVALA